jgi:hypothetical protein
MITVRGRQGFVVRIVVIWLFLFLTSGCVQRVQVYTFTFDYLVETKIPFRVALVVPDDLQKHDCPYVALTENVVFECGSALYSAIVSNMEALFVKVESVSEIGKASAPWDRALWFEVEELKIYYPGVTKTAHAGIRLKYKVTDNQNNETFSSEITVERYVTIQDGNPLLAFNEDNYSSNSEAVKNMQLAYMISVPGESIAKWGRRIITAAIDDLMKKILAEIIDAYGKQQL